MQFTYSSLYIWFGLISNLGLKAPSPSCVIAETAERSSSDSEAKTGRRLDPISIPMTASDQVTSPTNSGSSLPPGSTQSDSQRSTCGRQKPNRNCCKERYDAEYPCQSDDYDDVREAGTCLKYISSLANWDTATSSCYYEHGGHLVKVSNRRLDDAISRRTRGALGMSSYWIGLHNRELHKLGLDGYGWLTDKHPATYVNWVRDGLGPLRPGGSCALKIPISGRWRVVNCTDHLYSYVCQRTSAREPGSPTIAVNFPFGGSSQAYIYERLEVGCSSLTDRAGKIRFRMENESGVRTIMREDDYSSATLTLKEDGVYTQVDGRCFVRSQASLTLHVTRELRGTNLSCCWYRQNDSFSSCSRTVHLDPIYLPRRPELSVHSPTVLTPGSTLLATCSACVGSGGQLVWSLLTLAGQMEWASDQELTQQMQQIPGVFESNQTATATNAVGDDITAIEWLVEEDSSCGPRIRSTFQRVVSTDLNGGELTCRYLNPNNASTQWEDLWPEVRSPMFSVNDDKTDILSESSAYTNKTKDTPNFQPTVSLIALGLVILGSSLLLVSCLVVTVTGFTQKSNLKSSLKSRKSADRGFPSRLFAAQPKTVRFSKVLTLYPLNVSAESIHREKTDIDNRAASRPAPRNEDSTSSNDSASDGFESSHLTDAIASPEQSFGTDKELEIELHVTESVI